MLCAKPAVVDTRHPERLKVHRASTIPICSTLLERCKERGDEWASEIEQRVLACIDLVAAEAVYHDQCFSRFMLKKYLDKRNAGGKHQDGCRHQDKSLMHWFGLLISWLESESGAELYTLSELHSKMVELSDGSDV
jgi:hypothetical protein